MYKDKESYNAYMKEYMKNYQWKPSWKRITVSLSGEDYVKLQFLAEEEGRSLSACFRSLAMSQFKRNENYPSAVKQNFTQLVQIMRGIWNNINQIARHSNQFREFILREELHQQFKALEGQTKAFLSGSHKWDDH